MKNILAILVSAACIAAFTVPGNAEQLSFSGVDGIRSEALGNSDEPFATVLPISPDGPLEAFSGTKLAPFIPIQFDQFAISLLDITTNTDGVEDGQTTSFPHFQLNTGIKTESYLTDPQSLFMDELFGSKSDLFKISSSVVFLGMGFDFNSLYLKGNAFVGRSLDTLSGKLHSSQGSERLENQGVDINAYGYEASAGYQVSNMIALGAGFGKMTDTNKETDQTEKVYEVYAQAILAVAPGVQVKPEVGKVDRIKEETDTEEVDQSFYAGAIWEINF